MENFRKSNYKVILYESYYAKIFPEPSKENRKCDRAIIHKIGQDDLAIDLVEFGSNKKLSIAKKQLKSSREQITDLLTDQARRKNGGFRLFCVSKRSPRSPGKKRKDNQKKQPSKAQITMQWLLCGKALPPLPQ